MKKIKVGINGFGRIGRLVFRAIASKYQEEMEIVGINDLAPGDNLAYLLKYDSTHGSFSRDIRGEDGGIWLDGKKIPVYAEKDPAQLPWKSLGVDYVIESTGIFTQYEGASKHLQAGAKRVIISAPAGGKGEIPTFVLGVNHETYSPDTHNVVSNASCTTNCLAPITKVVLDHFGIQEAFMSTIHAVTATQVTVDGTSKKDWRGGRGAYQNIIPASTGAAKALHLCIPELKGKITGMSFRVPVPDVSVVDLSVKVEKKTSYKEICDVMRKEAEGRMKGILQVCDAPLVSSDFIGNTHSSILDVEAGMELNSTFFKLVSWYDNEMGYAYRVADLASYMGHQES